MSATWNFEADQSATFTRTLTLTDTSGNPINLTGATARMQLRQGSTLALELNTTNGRIVLGGTAGTVALTISATDTANLVGVYSHDLYVYQASGVVLDPTSGSGTFRPAVTI